MINNDIIKQNNLAYENILLTKEEFTNARNGVFNIKLTPTKYVPNDWFEKNLKNHKILCLYSGGQKHIHLLAASGAIVTVYDTNHNQLKEDEKFAKENNLMISTVEGDMTNLEIFKDNFFDMIFCPLSDAYIPDILPIFKECHRILKSGGKFLFSSINPFTKHNQTLEDLIGGQTLAGFHINGFYEDSNNTCHDNFKYFATKAIK